MFQIFLLVLIRIQYRVNNLTLKNIYKNLMIFFDLINYSKMYFYYINYYNLCHQKKIPKNRFK